MAGREKHKVYVYNFKGKYIRKFDSIAEFRNHYYKEDIGLRPLFLKTINSYKFQPLDKEIAFLERVGRDNAIHVAAIHNSKYCGERKGRDPKQIKVYNLKGEVIATFKNKDLLCKLMPHMNRTTIADSLKSSSERLRRHTPTELFFKYE